MVKVSKVERLNPIHVQVKLRTEGKYTSREVVQALIQACPELQQARLAFPPETRLVSMCGNTEEHTLTYSDQTTVILDTIPIDNVVVMADFKASRAR